MALRPQLVKAYYEHGRTHVYCLMAITGGEQVQLAVQAFAAVPAAVRTLPQASWCVVHVFLAVRTQRCLCVRQAELRV